MTTIELLNWARGPGLQISIAVFVLGSLVRVLEMWLIGRVPDLSEARGSEFRSGWMTVWRRALPSKGVIKYAPLVFFGGYVFHVGIFITVFFFMPHILLFKSMLGFGWPGLPNAIIDAVALVSIIALVAVLINRILDPVRRFLSTFHDYFIWVVTVLPLVSGYFAMHRHILPYNDMLVIHILSVELLLVVFPFTKLIHAFTLIFARWYNGAFAGRKGVRV